MLDESSRTGDLSFTIELWLRVAETRHPQASAIFSVHGGSDDSDLSIAQVGRDLVLQGHFRDRNGTQQRQLRFHDVFRSSQPIFVTITSSQEGTILYWDAKLQPPGRYGLAPESGRSFQVPELLGLATDLRLLPGLGAMLLANTARLQVRAWVQSDPPLFALRNILHI